MSKSKSPDSQIIFPDCNDRAFELIKAPSTLQVNSTDIPLYCPDVPSVPTNRLGTSSIPQGALAYLPKEYNALRTNHVDEVLEIPDTYSGFTEINTHLYTRQDITKYRQWGLTPQHFEDYVRAVVGDGRYQSNDLSLFVTTKNAYLLLYQNATNEAWLLQPRRVIDPPAENPTTNDW
jgi:hypothetical protein